MPGCCSRPSSSTREAARQRRAPVRPRRRRSEGRRQAGRPREARRAGGRGARRRQDGGAAPRGESAAVRGELPSDVVAAAEFDADAESRVAPYDDVPDGWLGLDIGPETRERFAEVLAPPGRCSGTARWACSSGRGSRRARRRSQRRSRASTGTRWSGRRLGARDLRARPRERGLVGLDGGRRLAGAARGQGASRRRRQSRKERLMLIAGNWKMFKGAGTRRARSAHRPAGVLRRRGRRRLSAVRLARRVQGLGSERRSPFRPERPLGGWRGRSPESLPADARVSSP